MNKAHLVLAIALIGAGGCAPEEAEAGAGSGSEAGALVGALVGALEVQAEWNGTTASGLWVTLRPDAVPVTVGDNRFHIAFRTALAENRSVSIDLVSPDMPMMGVVRYPAIAHGDAFMVDATVPMAGLWQLYVNVGDGTDAVAFEFEVEPASGEDAHAHHRPAPSDGDHEHH